MSSMSGCRRSAARTTLCSRMNSSSVGMGMGLPRSYQTLYTTWPRVMRSNKYWGRGWRIRAPCLPARVCMHANVTAYRATEVRVRETWQNHSSAATTHWPCTPLRKDMRAHMYRLP